MRPISFAWTTPALLAGVKTVTRRDWKATHAARHHAGDLLAAYDRQARYGGKQVAVIRLTADPVLESTAAAPESDYQAEGFEWLQDRGIKVDKLDPRALWTAWRVFPRDLWVVRFELVEIVRRT